MVVLGANGAGKTTTINMLAGFTPLTKGQIFGNGYFLSKNRNKVSLSVIKYFCRGDAMVYFYEKGMILELQFLVIVYDTCLISIHIYYRGIPIMHACIILCHKQKVNICLSYAIFD